MYKARRPREGPRRAARGLFWSLVLTLLLNGLVGFVAAGNGPQAPPAVPAPVQAPFDVSWGHVGDRGSFVQAAAPDFRERPMLDFETLPAQVMMDATGRARDVLGLRLAAREAEDGGAQGRTLYLDAWTGEPIAQDTAAGWADAQARGGPGNAQHAGFRHVRTFAGPGTSTQPAPCGLTEAPPPLGYDLRAPVALFRSCALGRLHTGPSGIGFAYNGTGRAGGYASVVLEGQAPDASWLRVWLAHDFPYPLRVERLHSLSTAPFEVFRLAGFEAGSEGRVAVHSPPMQAARLEWTTPTAWGLDESGVSHPYPLAVAYQDLKDEAPQFRAFAERLGVFVQYARYSDFVDDDQAERTWTISLTDGETTFTECIKRREGNPLGLLVPRSVSQEYHDPLAFSTDGCTDEPSYLSVPPASLADRLPTVASLLGRWRIAAPPAWSNVAPNEWGVDFHCGGAGCGEAGYHVFVGVTRNDVHDAMFAGTVSAPASVDQGLWELTMDGAGRMVAFTEARDSSGEQAQEIANLPEFQAHEPAPAYRALSSSAHRSLWTLPTPGVIAGFSILGLLAGGLYWAWPAIRDGATRSLAAIPLFTRIRTDRLLDQPERRRVHDAIQANPGITIDALSELSVTTRDNVRYHLRVLRRHGRIRQELVGGQWRSFTLEAWTPDARRRVSLAEDPKLEDLVRRATPVGRPAAELAEELRRAWSLSRSGAWFTLERAARLGLVKRVDEGGRQRIVPVASGAPAADA